MPDEPTNGDILITIEAGRCLLSIVPHPHKLSMAEFDAALEIAQRWAREHGVNVWRLDGNFVRLSRNDAES
jgi:hypothetical protein